MGLRTEPCKQKTVFVEEFDNSVLHGNIYRSWRLYINSGDICDFACEINVWRHACAYKRLDGEMHACASL